MAYREIKWLNENVFDINIGQYYIEMYLGSGPWFYFHKKILKHDDTSYPFAHWYVVFRLMKLCIHLRKSCTEEERLARTYEQYGRKINDGPWSVKGLYEGIDDML